MNKDSNVVHYLRQAAEQYPDRIALADATARQINFAQLWQETDRLSEGLFHAGLRPDDRVICMLPMSIQLYTVMLGILKMGSVAVFVDPWIDRRQIAAFAAFAQPRAFIGIPKSHVLRLLNPVLRRLPIAVTTGRRLGPLPAPLTLHELTKHAGNRLVVARNAKDTALITFTSGSSGLPKGVNRTHGFLDAQHRALKSAFSYHDDVDMPMFPVFALNNLATGITSVIPDMDFRRVSNVDPAGIVRTIAQHKVSTCTASPPFFDRLVQYLESQPGRRPALRRILTGGAPVSNAQLAQWRRQLPSTEILVVYGSTEAEPVAHISCEERLKAASHRRPENPGYCLGHPLDCVRTRIVRIHKGPIVLADSRWQDLEVPDGEIGELLVTGDHICRDYYRNPTAIMENKVIDSDGTVWHRMGDTVYRDIDGQLWLVGRVHTTICRDGWVLHPQLIELAVSAETGNRVAAVGIPDDKLGERLVVMIQSGQRGETGTLKARLAKKGIPVDDIFFTNRPLPVDPRHNSKIDYNKVRKLLRKTLIG